MPPTAPETTTASAPASVQAEPKPPPYGGQAVIEGVMIKGRTHAAVAVRRKDGSIDVTLRRLKSRFPHWVTQAYFLRGFFLLWDMLGLGFWAPNLSQDKYLEDLGEKPAEGKGSRLQFVAIAVAAVILALAIFKLLPTYSADLVNAYIYPVASVGWNNIMEGAIKFCLFIGYVALIGLMPDVRRVFMYHGAEHAAVSAYEHDPARGDDAEFAGRHSRLHPRCGTSFIAILIIVSIAFYYLLDGWLLSLGAPAAAGWPVWYVRWPLRILALPLLAGISYEILKGAYALRRFVLLRPLIYFGMLFQVLTTRVPTRDQLEVALAALNEVRRAEEAPPEAAAAPD